MSFPVPQTREEFLKLVQLVAKRDVLKLVAAEVIKRRDEPQLIPQKEEKPKPKNSTPFKPEKPLKNIRLSYTSKLDASHESLPSPKSNTRKTSWIPFSKPTRASQLREARATQLREAKNKKLSKRMLSKHQIQATPTNTTNTTPRNTTPRNMTPRNFTPRNTTPRTPKSIKKMNDVEIQTVQEKQEKPIQVNLAKIVKKAKKIDDKKIKSIIQREIQKSLLPKIRNAKSIKRSSCVQTSQMIETNTQTTPNLEKHKKEKESKNDEVESVYSSTTCCSCCSSKQINEPIGIFEEKIDEMINLLSTIEEQRNRIRLEYLKPNEPEINSENNTLPNPVIIQSETKEEKTEEESQTTIEEDQNGIEVKNIISKELAEEIDEYRERYYRYIQQQIGDYDISPVSLVELLGEQILDDLIEECVEQICSIFEDTIDLVVEHETKIS